MSDAVERPCERRGQIEAKKDKRAGSPTHLLPILELSTHTHC